MTNRAYRLHQCDAKALALRVVHRFYDPVRASRMLLSPAEHKIYLLVPDDPSKELVNEHGDGSLCALPLPSPGKALHEAVGEEAHGAQLESAVAVALYNITPGTPTFSIFVLEEERPYQQHMMRTLLTHLEAFPDKLTPEFKCAALPQWSVPGVHGVFGGAGFRLLYDSPCPKFTCTALPSAELLLPAGYYLDNKLTEADLQAVNDTWAYKSAYSLKLLRSLAAHNCVRCVRCHIDGAPAQCEQQTRQGDAQEPTGRGPAVAWALQCHDGSIGVAYTLQEHRRRGLMRAVILALTRDVLATGQHEAFSYVVQDNNASLALFRSLPGFTEEGVWHWIGYAPPG